MAIRSRPLSPPLPTRSSRLRPVQRRFLYQLRSLIFEFGGHGFEPSFGRIAISHDLSREPAAKVGFLAEKGG